MATPYEPVGQNVVFFEQGDLKGTPIPAFVYRVVHQESGRLDLGIRRIGDPSIQHKASVHHMSFDVKDNVRKRTGSWATVEEAENIRLELAAAERNRVRNLQAKKEQEAIDREIRDQIVVMHADGATPSAIAKKISTRGWTAERVAQELERLTLQSLAAK